MRVRLGGTVMDNDSAAIYRMWGYKDVCCPKDVRDAVANCPEGEELIFELNSPGGSAYQGFEMYSVIRAHKGQTVAEVQGVAASAMSVIMVACDKVRMSPVANVMIHRASTIAMGNSRDMRETKQMLDTIDESILTAYVGKSDGKCKREDFARMMRSETFMTAQEAVDCGLADEIMEASGEADPAKAVASAGPWAGFAELPPVEDLLRREQERESGPKEEAGAAAPAEQESEPIPQEGENQNARSEATMEIENKEQLMEKFPELTDQIAQEAAEAAAKAERERIAAIDALTMPGCEEIIAKAKADPAKDAGAVAMEIIRAQKESGAAFLANVQKDAEASNVNQVPACASEAGAGAGGEGEETVEQAAKAAVDIWKGAEN